MESSSQPPRRQSIPADGRAGARPSPARSPAIPAAATRPADAIRPADLSRRERVYRGILVTAPDLTRIAEVMRAAAGTIELSAEDYRFASADELVDFALEEMSIAHLEMAARDGDQSLRLTYAADRVVLSASARRPDFTGAFWSAAAVLDSCRPTGSAVCDIAPGEAPARGVMAALRRVAGRREASP
jgi:hypothetical protein